MPSTTIIISIAIIIVSFFAGIIIFYLLSVDSQEQRKKQVEDIVSLTINFIIYIWIGKIIVNFSKFITDPLAILAYPSNSYAVYIATVLIIINLLYRKYRHQENISLIIEAFIPVFLAASFLYEFLQLVIEYQSYNKLYLLFTAGLTLGYILLYGKVSVTKTTYLFGFSLLIGQVILTYFTYLTVFGYRLLPIYFISLIIINLVVTIIRFKRKV